MGDLPDGVWLERGIGPEEVGGGDEFLGVCGECGEEGVAAAGVEFAEDVVEEEDGVAAGEGAEDGGLGEFEGEGDGALLAFAAEAVGWAGVDGEGEVVAVGACGGDAAAEFFVAETFELGWQIGFRAWEGSDGEEFGGRADGGVGGGGFRGEGGEELGAEGGEDGGGVGEDAGVGVDLPPWRGGVAAEEEVAGAEGGFAAAEGWAVFGEELGTEEVEVAAADFAGAGDEVAVGVAEPDDEPAGGEVVSGFALGGAVDGEGTAVGTCGVAEFAVIEGAGDAEGIGGEADEFASSGGAR